MIRLLLMFAIAPAAPPLPPIVVPPPAPPAAKPLNDSAALAERIASTSKRAGERLARQSAGPITLRDQQQVKDDLDALIELLQPPPSSSPPPPPPPPMPDDKNPPPPPPEDQKPPPPPPKPDAGGAPQPQKPEQPAPAPQQPASPEEKKRGSVVSIPPEESLARDFWGHLPDAPRQQMMQFYREQYMTKYKDLLARYYESLAEKERGGKP